MKKNTNKILCGIIAIIIIVGVFIGVTKGVNKELLYLDRQEIIIASKTEMNIEKVEEISKTILEGQEVKIQKVERFGNAAKIISTQIKQEQKEEIINKINDELGLDISKEDTEIIDIPSIKIKDIIRPYILPLIFSYILVLLYLIIVYKKIGLSKVILKGISIPIIAELTYYSVILITRLPLGRVVNGIAMGIYIISIGALAIYFQREKEKLPKNKNEKEND